MDVSHCLVLLAALVTSQAANHVSRGPPRIQPPTALPHRYIKEDARVNLPCNATGDPAPKYSWTLNTRSLRAEATEYGDRTIVDFKQNDEGVYQCTATNQWGTSMSQLITVYIARLGEFPGDKSVSDVDGKVGEPLKVPRLDIDCAPTPKYDWKIIKNVDDSTPKHLVRNQRVLQDIEGNLYFTFLEIADDDLYKVEVSNNINDAKKGGSYSRIRITEAAQVENSAPRLLYPKTSPHQIMVVEGKVLKVQCIFSGKPEVTVNWEGPDNPKMTKEEAGTRLKLDTVTQEDAGTYTCTGTNTEGTASASIQVEVQTLPKFDDSGKPKKQNPAFTGDLAKFTCRYSQDTKPAPTVTWMRNRVAINNDLSPRSTLRGIQRGKELVMKDLVRSDSGVIQCKLTNKHGTVYAEAELNVFIKTTVTVDPEFTWLKPNVTVVRFTCSSLSDPDTSQPTISWWYRGKRIDNKNPAVQVAGGTLSISLRGAQSDNEYTGTYTCTASDGLSSASHNATLYATKPIVAATRVAAASSSMTLVGVGVALLLLVLMLLVLTAVYRNKNKGQTYHSEKRERKLGINPLADMDGLTFVEYQRRPDRVPKASNASIRGPPTCGSDAGDSVVEYGDLTEGKFDEDGSFIGISNGIYAQVEERSVA